MASFGLVFTFFLLLFSSITQVSLAHATDQVAMNETWDMEMVPMIGEEKMIMVNESRRRLGSFQICSLCTCCGRKGYCMPSPCCYAINCNIPNRPFGFCSFTPKTCNCFRCHI